MAEKIMSTNTGELDSSGGASPYYRVWMWKGGSQKISTAMPENWSTQIQVGWQAQFATLLQDMMGGVLGPGRSGAVQNVMAAAGFQIQNKLLGSQIWTGTSEIDINIPFVFKVEEDVEKELLQPIGKLMEWALPSVVGNPGVLSSLLEAPYKPFESIGTKMFSKETSSVPAKTAASPVTVLFGNFFMLPACVITGISQSYDSIFDKNGKPLSAKIDLNVKSTTIITIEDIESMFLGSLKIGKKGA